MYAPNGNMRDVLVTSDVTIDGTGVVTNSGEELNSVELGNYAAVSNGGKGGAEANTECHYIIETENGWENVGVGTDKFDKYFKTVDNDSENGLKYDNEKGVYTYKGEVVSSDNIYYIKDGDTVNAGVFVVNGEVYKSTVYGNTKEILTTVKDENGSLKTFWSTEAESSDIYLKDSNIKVSDLNTAFDTIEANEKRLENNDIREITVTPNENKIGLVRNSDKEVDGSIYVSSVVGENGNAQVKFAQKGEDGQETSSFVVDAGSIVKANPEGATSGTKLSTVAINGINYQLATGISGGEVGDDGTVYITQEGSTEKTPIGKIEVVGTDVNVTSEQTTNDGVKGIKYTVSNNLTVAEDKDTDENKGNWTITDASKPEGQQKFTNTTLDKAGSTVADGTTANGKVYGKTYTVKDTSGNTIQLTDVASGSVLQNVDSRVTTIEGNVITQGVRDTTGDTPKGNLLLQNAKGETVATVTGLEDYALKDQTVTVDDEGNAVFKVTDRYDPSKSYDVKLDGLVTEASMATANNLTVAADDDNDGNNGNWTITDASKPEGQQKFTNTTLDKAGSTVADGTTANGKVYGKTYTVKDTSGNTIQLIDVASGNVLQNVDSKVGDTNYSSTNYIHNEDNLTTAASILDSNIKATADKVDAGWTATAGGNSIAVNPTETGTTTLNFAGDKNINVTADKASSTINVKLDPTLEVESVTATGSVNVGRTTISSTGLTAGDVKVNAESATVTGLSNTTWNKDYKITTGQAATEDQLQAAVQDINTNSYKGWNVTTNKGTKTAKVASDGNVDFSNNDKNIIVGQDGTNLTFDLNDNITLGDESGTRIQLNGNPQTDSMISITNKDSHTVFNVAKDGTVLSDGDIIAKADSNKKYSLSEVGENAVRYNNEDKSTVALAGTSGTTITNVADGALNEKSTEAVNGSQLYAVDQKVNDGWTAKVGNDEINVRPNGENETGKDTLSFAGDDNITVTADAENNAISVGLNDNITLGEGDSQIHLNGAPKEGEVLVAIGSGENPKFMIGQNGEITANAGDTSFNLSSDGVAVNANGTSTIMNGQSVIVGSDVNGEGGVVINNNGSGTINGLSNTTWDKDNFVSGQAATEDQLQQATAASKTTLSDGVNTTVTFNDNTPDGHVDYQVNLNDNVYLGGNNKPGSSNIELDGENGTIQVGSNIILDSKEARAVIGGVDISTTFDDIGKKSSTITGLSNTTWDTDKVVIDRAATEGQLQMVSDKVIAGWTATDDAGNKINVNPDNHPTLNFASGKNITVSAVNDEVEVSLNDNINLNDRVYINGDPEEGNNTIVDIKSGNTSKEESIFAVEDKGNGSISIGGIDITNVDGPYLAVGDGKLKFYKDGGLSTGNATGTFSVRPDGDLEISGKNSSFNVDAETGNVNAINSSGSAIMMNDDSIALNASGNGVAISDEGILLNTNGIDEDIKLVTKGTTVSVDKDGATFTNTNTNETTNINGGTINVGDKLVVDQDGTTTIAVNDGTVMGNNTTMTVNKDGVSFSAYGNGTTVIDGQTISAGGVVINNNGSGTINGLTNTTWDDELAKQVADSEELQGTAATQGQLQQAVSAVATEAAKQHTTVSGDDNLTVKSSVNENGGTNYQVTLDDDITLGNPKAGNTKGERSFTINTTAPEGYVPDSYKEENSSGAEFIKENGGFMLFATDTQGHGIFGVTAKGSAWAKDFKTYTTDIYGNNTQYSLNDVGDAVAQMSSYYNKENGKSYTVFSHYLNEAEKDKPFETVDKNATRDIPLALRDDGAVLIGATIKGDDFTDNGIRINAETETTYDENGKEVTNNVATITGLENTTWTPPAPVATFANEGTETSRAATEAQLNDLYGTVVGYNVDTDGVNYGTVTLGGGRTSYDKDTHEGGTVLNNVAYASGKDGSEAVNVDYLNNAIKDAVKDGPVASNEKHLDTSKTYTPDKTTGTITINEVDGTGAVTGNQLVINDVASKAELDSLKTGVGDRNYNNVTDTTPIANGDSVTTAIGKLNNSIKGVTQDVINNSISGGHVDETGKVVLEKGEGENKSEVTTDIQLTDSEVSGVTLEKDTETGKNVLTITSTDKYDKNKTSSVTVSGLEIASTDDIKDVTGVASSEDLKDAYKDADKDGNATTEYITESGSMVEADVALDHAIQDVANTGYANDMVLSNRIDSVEKRLGNVEERIDKVGAMAAAIANLRTMGFDPEAPTEIAIGVGQYKSETGIAIGVFHYPNQDFMLSASLSSSGDELMGGIGATWKLGRKSAAERAKDEEARHLEQAEEMKKLAQQEKVKAQAQRHAKLLAERQQASQKNA